eukprot:3044766-Prymnesium_polylepis.1
MRAPDSHGSSAEQQSIGFCQRVLIGQPRFECRASPLGSTAVLKFTGVVTLDSHGALESRRRTLWKRRSCAAAAAAAAAVVR